MEPIAVQGFLDQLEIGKSTQGEIDAYRKAYSNEDLFKQWEAEQDPEKQIQIGYLANTKNSMPQEKTFSFKDAAEHERKIFFANDIMNTIRKKNSL